MSDDDMDFELVTNARQLAGPPPPRREKVILPDWKTTSGKPAGFYVYELTAADYNEFLESGRVYKDGDFQKYSLKNEDLRLLAFTVRDANNNRLWHTVEAAEAALGQRGKASINLLVAASNRVNSANQASAEGNSDETRSAS